MGEDRELVGTFVRRQIEGQGAIDSFANDVDIARGTLYRIFRGDPVVSWGKLNRIETFLELPVGTLTLIAAHDWDGLRDVGVRGDMVQWLQKQTETAD